MASVIVTAGILSWARETFGLTVEEVEEKSRLPREIILQFEKGEKPITLSKLKYFANLYKRPLATFFLPTIPDAPAIPADFRTLDSIKNEKLTPNVRLAIRRAQRNRRIMKDILGVLDERDYFSSRNLKNYTLNDNPEELAISFRKGLGVPVAVVKEKWKDKSEALRRWLNVMEQQGILVSQMTLPIEDMRAFCLKGSELPPAIVLNSSDEAGGRIFSLWHEFAHLLLSQEEVSNLERKIGEERAYKLIEKFANHFAGAFLVPANELMTNQFFAKYKESKSDYHLARIAGNFKVSNQVMLRRLFTLSVIDKEFYEIKKKEFDDAFEEYKKKSKVKKDGFQEPSSKAFQTLGGALTERLFEAQGKGRLNNAEISGYFEVKVQHFGKIKELLDKRNRQ